MSDVAHDTHTSSAPHDPAESAATLATADARAGRTAAPSAVARAFYQFGIDSFRITDTRALHEDTAYVSLSVVVGDRPPIKQTKRIGDVNNGTHHAGLSFIVGVADDERVVLTYAIVNNGHGNPTEVERGLETAVSTLAQKGAQAAATAVGAAVGEVLGASIGTAAVPLVGTALGAIAGWLVGAAGGLLFANCDGPVAAGVHVFTGAQLRAAPGGLLTHEDNSPGVDSPTGCGRNSQYYVTWTARHR